MLEITKQEEIDKYFADGSMNQSLLKSLLRGVRNYNATLKEFQRSEEGAPPTAKEKLPFIIGSAVDLILLGEKGEFEKQFHVSNIKNKPSDAIVAIIKEFVQGLRDFENTSREEFSLKEAKMEDHLEFLITIADNKEYCMHFRKEKRIERLLREGGEYFKDLVNSLGKQVLSQEEHAIIQRIVNSLKSHNLTAEVFDREIRASDPHTTTYYQRIFYFEYAGVKCKAMLDILYEVINEKEKTIFLEIVDLKTMSGETSEFPKSIRRFRYDIQMYWYFSAVTAHYEANFPGYTIKIAPPKFIVESTTHESRPLIYVASEDLLKVGKHGLEKVISKEQNIQILRKVHGVEYLIYLYKFHEKIGFVEDREVLLTGGVLTVDWNGIVEE